MLCLSSQPQVTTPLGPALSDNAYGATARVLHRLALASPVVAQASHDLESMMNRGTRASGGKGHVFIAGLARAGTTVLMRSLYQSGRFRSLTYRDMPFVLMPKTWSGLTSLFRRHKAKEERAHGDRVLVDFDSPEAFEEVFWRSFCGDDYIFDTCLKPHRPDDDTIGQFRRFVGNVLASGDTAGRQHYLSKNNNNLLRLSAIAEAFPEASICIPFRDPVQHALSLKRQHALFLDTHSQDRFALEYMNWLGHHEFGGNHRPFRFGAVPEDMERYGPDSLDYWLCCWIDAYSYVLENLPGIARLISYEDLCQAGSGELDRLLDHVALSLESSAPGNSAEVFDLVMAKPHVAPDTNPGIRAQAYDLYSALRAAR